MVDRRKISSFMEPNGLLLSQRSQGAFSKGEIVLSTFLPFKKKAEINQKASSICNSGLQLMNHHF
jgi:hypothetical protein